jgi:hypothetical protein
MNKTIVALVGLILILIAGMIYQTSLNRQSVSDEELILTLLQRGQTAVEHTDPRAAMSVVSPNYKDSMGLTYRLIRGRATQALTSGVQPDVTILNPVIRINGHDAVVDAHVRITDTKSEGGQLFDHDLQFRLHKEKIRKYLVFSTMEWRITAIEGFQGILE